MSESSKQEDDIEVPKNFCSYTIQDRSIILQIPKRENLETLDISYDSLDNANKFDLVDLKETPRWVSIVIDLSIAKEELLVSTLKEYHVVFAWSYKDLKGVDPEICQHTIPMREDAKPSRQRPYTYNANFAKKILEAKFIYDIDKLLEAEFIYEIELIEWVSLIVFVPKKNGNL